MTRIEVVPAELVTAGASLRGVGREAAFVGLDGHGSVGCEELSGALGGFCSRAHGTAAQLHRAGFAVAAAYAAGAAGYEATDQSAMPQRD